MHRQIRHFEAFFKVNFELVSYKFCVIEFINILYPYYFGHCQISEDRLCGLVVRVLDYRSGGPGSILGTTRKKSSGSGRGPLSPVSTTEELLDRKVAAPV
jgi:hypothetical protein